MTKAASSSEKTPSFEMSWGSSTSSGYCSEEDPDSEFEQYFTARTSFFPKTRKANVNVNVKQVSERVFKQHLTLGSNKSFFKRGSDTREMGDGWFTTAVLSRYLVLLLSL